MAPILPPSPKALARLFLRRGGSADDLCGKLGTVGRSYGNPRRLERLSQHRCWSSSVCIGNPGVGKAVDPGWRISPSPASSFLGSIAQKRSFLGCWDREEGAAALSKTHEERLVVGYSPEQLFAVVAAVDLYEDFLPWCQRSKIMRHYNDGSFDAELEIGFKFLVESYVSHVVLKKPKYIKSSVSESALFDQLINVWELNPGPVPGSCDLHFLVDFKFQSPIYSQVASMFFKEVVSRLVSSLTDRCRRIYGPAVQVLEGAYGDSAARG